MNLIPLESLVDDVWGKIGTPERDTMEKQLHEELFSNQPNLEKNALLADLRTKKEFFA